MSSLVVPLYAVAVILIAWRASLKGAGPTPRWSAAAGLLVRSASGVLVLGLPAAAYLQGWPHAAWALSLSAVGCGWYVWAARTKTLQAETPAEFLGNAYGSRWVRGAAAGVGFTAAAFQAMIQTVLLGLLFEWLQLPAALGVGLGVVCGLAVSLVPGRSAVDRLHAGVLLFGLGAATLAGTTLALKVEGAPPATALDETAVEWLDLLAVAVVGTLGLAFQPTMWAPIAHAERGEIRRAAGALAAWGVVFGVFAGLLGYSGRLLLPLRIDDAWRASPHPAMGDAGADAFLPTLLQGPIAEQALGGMWIACAALAAVGAALLGNLSAQLHACGRLWSRDLYATLVRPQASETEKTWMERAAMLGVTLCLAGAAFTGGTTLNVAADFAALSAGWIAQLAPAAVCSAFRPKINAWGVVAGLAVGSAFVLCGSAVGQAYFARFPPAPWVAPLVRPPVCLLWGLALNAGMLLVVSWVTQAKPTTRLEPTLESSEVR